MLGSRSPANGIIRIEFDTRLTLLFIDNLETVVVDEHVGRSALEFVGRDGLLDGFDGGRNNGMKTFLVDGTLDRDVREDLVGQSRGFDGGIIL